MTNIEACICTIGDEILIGQIVDTNSAFISSRLNEAGIKVASMVSIGDDFDQIIENLTRITKDFNIVVITGGLGPTKDDITKKALAHFTGCNKFTTSREQLGIIDRIFKNRGMTVTQTNIDQATVPANCVVIPNEKGTAPAMVFNIDSTTILFSLPGVPYEMEALLPYVIEKINQKFLPRNICHRTICTYGIPESTLSDMLTTWESSLPPEIKLAYLPNPATGIRLRLSTYNGDKNASRSLIEGYIKSLKEILSPGIIYSEQDDTLESVVSRLIEESGMTVSVAESCTGGKISSLLVSKPGASNYYKGGVITYSNESKISILNVDPYIIDKHGAVSRECASQMAEGCRLLFGTDIAISTTGIAGPDGGTDSKPVGTIWTAVSVKGKVHCAQSLFFGDRERNLIRFTSEAFNFLRKELILYIDNK
jgi:nicotinamide-nucleotide amidase